MLEALVVVALQLAVDADSAQKYLARADAAIEALEYAEALELYTLATSVDGATAEQIARAHMGAGIAARVIGNDTQARMHFFAVLRERPDAELPGHADAQSPKVRAFFELVRTEVRTLSREATATPPPPPPPAPEPSNFGIVVVGVGAAIGLGGGGIAVIADQLVGDVARPLDERRAWQLAGIAGLVGVGVGVVGVVAGGAVAVIE